MHTGIDIGMGCTFMVTLDDDGTKLFADYFGTKVNAQFARASHYHLSQRHLMYYERICDYFDKNNISGTIVIEQPMGLFPGDALRIAEEFGYLMVAVGKRFKPNKVFLPKAKTIKLCWTGNGNASKDEMMDQCKNIGHFPHNQHEADAVAMAWMSIKGEV